MSTKKPTKKPRKSPLLNPKLPKDVDVKVGLSRALYDRLKSFAGERGTNIETLIRVATSAMVRANRYYTMNTALTFGKYTGEAMETVIRLDPGYVQWCLEKRNGMAIDDECEELLERMLKDVIPWVNPDGSK